MKPLYELEVSDDRMEKALAVIQNVAAGGLPFETVLEVFHQLGFSDAIAYTTDESNPADRLKLEMTGVQYVALAAALAAVKETGGKMIKTQTVPTPDAPVALLPDAPPDVTDILLPDDDTVDLTVGLE